MLKTEVPERVLDKRKDWALNDAKRDMGLIEPSDVKQIKNISYGPYGTDNLMDIYKPLAKENELLPIIINVHGGGFFYGDKELYRFYAMDMARFGFAVININYRLAPENVFPAPLEDINAVILWIEKNAEEYKLDTDKLFMMGDSAGAQLTSHYAAINSNKEFFKLYSLSETRLKIKKIATACGMYDIIKGMQKESEVELYKDYLGDKYDPENSLFDVCGAITENYPETFAFSAPNDFLYEECAPFVKLINERGGKAVLKIYGSKEDKNLGHVFHLNFALKTGAVARKDQAEFLSQSEKTPPSKRSVGREFTNMSRSGYNLRPR